MKIPTLCLLSTLVALGCTTKENAALIITKVVPPTATAVTGPPASTTCTVDPATLERSYIVFNPAENAGQVGVIVSNQMTPSVTVNPILRSETAIFLPDHAVIDYEVLSATLTTVGQQISPASGVEVAPGATGAITVIMFPQPSDVAGIAEGTFIRTTFHLEGKLADNSSVHTSEREYLFRICKTAGCANNVCL
jgi:hypothetical protein